MSLRRILLIVVLAGIAAGCTTVKQSQPERTATEQLLISRAADEAAGRLAVGLPAETTVYVDAGNFDGYDHGYAIGTVKDRLLKGGARLVADRSHADVVVEVRSGALSIDKSDSLVGIPSFDIPVPLAGPLTFPEIALFKNETQQGVAKFAMTAYGAKDGALRASSGPVYGFSHRTKWVVLLFISWTTDDLIPDEQESDRLLPDAPES